MKRIFLTLIAVVAAAGCGAVDQGGTEVLPTNPASTPAEAPTTTPTARPTTPATTGTRQVRKTTPVTVVHQPAVPPVPVVTRIRYAAHPQEGYDRLVLDIPCALPGYSAKYVAQVRMDGSDQPVTLPGSHYLLIVLNPASAHRENGTATVSGTHRIDLPMIKSYAVVGDYEGYVSVALGLNGKAGYRIGELNGRIFIDVASA
jgi:hypothetical protein